MCISNFQQLNISATMSKIVINSFEELEQYVGKELGVSDYITITQEQINLFADATLDHQWIHVDTEKAKSESPYKTTIAHGYLNLSVLPYLWNEVVEVNNSKLTVNYGIESLRFNQPVLVNSEVRVRAKLKSLKNLRGISKAEIQVSMEINGNKKTALDATIVFLYHFV
jgi:acyl dehydratase